MGNKWTAIRTFCMHIDLNPERLPSELSRLRHGLGMFACFADARKRTAILVPNCSRLWLLVLALLPSSGVFASGNWLKLGHTAPDSVSFMLLLSDGTVMAANNPDDVTGDF